MDIAQILRNLKFTPKESDLYLELLKIGSQSAAILARRLGYPRSTAQFVAESLVKKGFVSKSIKNKTSYYTAESLEKILELIDEERDRFIKNILEQKEQIKNLIPLIEKIQSKGVAKKPEVYFYEGTDGLARVYDDVLSAQEEVRSLVSYTKAHLNKPEKLVIYKKRAAKKIPIRCISRDSQMARERQKNNQKELRKSVLIDPKKYSWIPEVQLYDNKVNIASIDENFGVIIESEQIAKAMKVLFDLAWKGAEAEE
jgi:sugar-specific transcriptional regulator TrmB